MRIYTVSCSAARLRGAIGAFHLVSVKLPADSPGGAETVFRQQFETCGPPVEIRQAKGPDPA